MSKLWRTFFGFADDRILRYAEANQHAEAMYLLGWCYWRGQGVAEDAVRAVRLWQRSAAMGFAPSQHRCDEIASFIASL
ncbi:MAG: SEL1-like repeat protein [Prevotellaceae bacterium]|nr:SEL1-like repeat protein [Prevotellaceae bacterium]